MPQELTTTVPHYKIPFVLVTERGVRPYSMVVDILEYPWVVRPLVEFADVADLVNRFPTAVVAPAEARLAERRQLLDTLFAQNG